MSLELLPYPEDFEQANATTTSPPAHWRTTRIKYLLREIDDRSPTGTEVLLSMRQTLGLVPHNDVSDKPIAASALIGYKRVVPGDIVVNRMRASTGMVAAAPASGLVSPDYAVFRPIDDVDTAYLTLLFKSPAMQTAFRIESKGLGTGSAGFLRLYSDRFAAITIPVPSRFEQGTIVAFVRSWDRRITRLIRAKRRQIELLNEQKQAIIHQAVTRGLDPAVPLKPSGIEWLGDVPAHWSRIHLGSSVTIVNGYPFDSERFSRTSGTPLVRIRDIYATHTDVRYSGPDVPEARIDSGDVLVGMDGDFNVSVWNGGPALLNQRVCCVRPGTQLERNYVALVLPLPLKWINDQTFSTTVKHLSSSDIRRLRLYVPSVSEQRQIAKAVQEETVSVRDAIDRLRREIDLIREYRTRLIADVVTGKLDVRGAEIQQLGNLDPFEDRLDPDVYDELGTVDTEEQEGSID